MSAQTPDTPTTVHRVQGVPGAGKTTALLGGAGVESYAERFRREEGLEPEDYVIATFTNAHKSDIIRDWAEMWSDRIEAAKGGEEGEWRETVDTILDRCNTLHAHTLHLLMDHGVIEDSTQIITMDSDTGVYREFCDQHGLDFQADDTDPLEQYRVGQDIDANGNQLFALVQWLSQNAIPIESWHRAPMIVDLYGTEDYLRDWESFKRSRDLYEHHDYIALAAEEGYVPDVSALIVDEYQDYSPSEHRLIKTWRDSGVIDHIILCGDAQQEIYGFKGADSRYLTETHADRDELLKASFRCPPEIANVACGIIGDDAIRSRREPGAGAAQYVPTTDDDEFAGLVRDALSAHYNAGGDGEYSDAVEDLIDFGYVDGVEAPADLLILARTGRMVGQIASVLMDAGIPFRHLGEPLGGVREPPEADAVWADDVLSWATAIQQIEERGPVVPKPVMMGVVDVRVVGYGKNEVVGEMDDGTPLVDASEVFSIEGDVTAEKIIAARDRFAGNDFTYRQKRALRGVSGLDSEHRTAPEPDRIKIGTMHAAKGAEAPAVMVLDDSTARIRSNYQDHADDQREEERVHYVACTRASQTLTVLNSHFRQTKSPVFESGVPRAFDDVTEVIKND